MLTMRGPIWDGFLLETHALVKSCACMLKEVEPLYCQYCHSFFFVCVSCFGVCCGTRTIADKISFTCFPFLFLFLPFPRVTQAGDSWLAGCWQHSSDLQSGRVWLSSSIWPRDRQGFSDPPAVQRITSVEQMCRRAMTLQYIEALTARLWILDIIDIHWYPLISLILNGLRFSLLIRDGKSAQELRFATGHFLSGCLGPFHMQPRYLPPWICTENATREAQCPIQGRDSGTWNLATAHVSFKEHGKSPHVIGSYKNIIDPYQIHWVP